MICGLPPTFTILHSRFSRSSPAMVGEFGSRLQLMGQLLLCGLLLFGHGHPAHPSFPFALHRPFPRLAEDGAVPRLDWSGDAGQYFRLVVAPTALHHKTIPHTTDCSEKCFSRHELHSAKEFALAEQKRRHRDISLRFFSRRSTTTSCQSRKPIMGANKGAPASGANVIMGFSPS